MSNYRSIQEGLALFRGPKRVASTPATEFSVEGNVHALNCKVRDGKSCSCKSKGGTVRLSKSSRKGRVIGRRYAALEPSKPAKPVKAGKAKKAKSPDQVIREAEFLRRTGRSASADKLLDRYGL